MSADAMEVEELTVDSADQPAGEEASLEVEAPSIRGKHVKVGLVVTSVASLGLGLGLGTGAVKTWAWSRKNANAPGNSVSMTATSIEYEDEYEYDCGGELYYRGKSGKARGGTYAIVGRGRCTGADVATYSGLEFTPFLGTSERCQRQCEPNTGGMGFRGIEFNGDFCRCLYDDGMTPNCPNDSSCEQFSDGSATGPVIDAIIDPGDRNSPVLCYPYLYGKSGKAKSGKAKSGKSGKGGYDGDYEKVGDGICAGQYPPYPNKDSPPQGADPLYEGLLFRFDFGTISNSLCRDTCSSLGGPGFRGYSLGEDYESDEGDYTRGFTQCFCVYDQGYTPDCPSPSDLGITPFLCIKTEFGYAVGPITSLQPVVGTVPECYRALESYGGKSGKNGYTEGYGHGPGLGIVDDGFCRDSDGRNYDSVHFLVGGIVDREGRSVGYQEDDEPVLLELCEAKCKSPPSFNLDMEHFAATGLVGVNYKNLFFAESEDVREVFSLFPAISPVLPTDDNAARRRLNAGSTSPINPSLVGPAGSGGKSGTSPVNPSPFGPSGSAGKSGKQSKKGLLVSYCTCDYTKDTLSCIETDDSDTPGVITAFNVGVLNPSDRSFMATDINLPEDTYTIAAFCYDDFDGQGRVSGTFQGGGTTNDGFACFRNNGFSNWYPYDGPPFCHEKHDGLMDNPIDPVATDADAEPRLTPTPDIDLIAPRQTPMPTEGSTPTVSVETTGPPTKQGRDPVRG